MDIDGRISGNSCGLTQYRVCFPSALPAAGTYNFQFPPGTPVTLHQAVGGTGYTYNQAEGTGSITYSRSEEHTSELQSLMRISFAVFCLIKKHTLSIQ